MRTGLYDSEDPRDLKRKMKRLLVSHGRMFQRFDILIEGATELAYNYDKLLDKVDTLETKPKGFSKRKLKKEFWDLVDRYTIPY